MTSQTRTDEQASEHGVLLAVCLALLFGAALLSVSPGGDRVNLGGLVLPGSCPTRLFLDIGCPGCGLTRSFISLSDGDLTAAWGYNRAGPAVFLFVVLQVLYRIVRLRRPQWNPPRRLFLVLPALIVLLFLNWALVLVGV